MKSKKKIVIVVLLLLFIFSSNLFACNCIGQSSVKNSLKESNIVFKGQVIEIELITIPYKLIGMENSINYYYNKITFKINIIYKGKLKSETLQIITGIGNGDCGYVFEKGEKYIVYSNWRDKFFYNGKKVEQFLYTNICSRTTSEIVNEEAEIKKYRKSYLPCSHKHNVIKFSQYRALRHSPLVGVPPPAIRANSIYKKQAIRLAQVSTCSIKVWLTTYYKQKAI